VAAADAWGWNFLMQKKQLGGAWLPIHVGESAEDDKHLGGT